MSKRLGFVTFTGVVLGVAVLVGVLAWTLIAGPALYSSGPLNAQSKGHARGGVASHAQLGDNCGACHAAPWSSQTMADRCLVCHKEVVAELRAKRGMHGRLAGGLASPTCRGCHTDHRGPGGSLTVLDVARFPHQLTGYSLGEHKHTASGARFTCADCHPQGLARFSQATCARCHASMDAAFMRQHIATFGKQCVTCHNGDGSNFDHNKLPFKLEGKHAGLQCSACHRTSKTLAQFRNTPQDCYSCHAKDDQHHGAFGKLCEQCHTPKGWAGATFDHSVFPLDHGSSERTATCQTCHPNGKSTYTCYGCHAHTPTNVRSTHETGNLARLANCIRCHPGGRQGGD